MEAQKFDFYEHFQLLLKDFLETAQGAELPASLREALLRPDPCDHFDCFRRLNVDGCLASDDAELIRSCCRGDLSKASVEGAPVYPLYKHMAAVLCDHLFVDSVPKTSCCTSELTEDEGQKTRMLEFLQQFQEHGSALLKDFGNVNYRLHVQDNFLRQLQDGSKVVEGRCACGSYSRVQPGDRLLFNNVLYMEVKDLRRYTSFKEMLEIEGLDNVLPGVQSFSEGVQIYRQFYSEEIELRGVLAIHVVRSPTLQLHKLLSSLQVEGVMSLLGIKFTKGTVTTDLPPARSLLISSFLATGSSGSSRLTVGGRALAKHVHRSNLRWWGDCTGTESAKNKAAVHVLCRILDRASWMNIHHLPQSTFVFELRVGEGYGARWSSDGLQFRGFLEPQMKDGHACKWRH